MPGSAVHERLGRLWESSPLLETSSKDRVVIFSDLHLGDGGHADDCVHNESLIGSCMERFYLDGRWRLVLNGDIEELYRFSVCQITRRWHNLYGIFRDFRRQTDLFKLTGNHDMVLGLPASCRRTLVSHVEQAFRLHVDGIRLFVLHGHQASRLWDRMYRPGRLFFRLVGNPLGIHNYSVSRHSRKRYQIERRVHDFALASKLIAVIGHTHRPLFESLSVIDSLRYKIEKLCRDYAEAEEEHKPELERKIRVHNRQLTRTLARDRRNGSRASLYRTDDVVPCVFNSGCAVGKRGITAIEIEDGDIRLVHWFDRNRSTKYFDLNGYRPSRLDGTDFYRVVLKSESLKYVDARIRLLS